MVYVGVKMLRLMNIKWKCILGLLICSFQGQAQDVHFSQFYESSALRNPALTGIFSGDYKLFADYRSQWGSFVVPYKTALFAGESKVLLNEATRDFLSFGFTAVYDRAGSIDLTGISLYGSVNYNKSLGLNSKTYLSVGLCGGYLQRSFDITKMQFSSQYSNGVYSATAATNESMNWGVVRHYDVSAGVSLSGAITNKVNYYLGGAAYHVSHPTESYFDETLVRLSTRYSGNAGISANMGQGYGLIVHFNYQYQEPYQETIGGFLISHGFHNQDNSKKVLFAAGCFYRAKDAYIPTFKIDYNSWSLTMSYDMAVAANRLYLNGFGGYEMSISMRGNYNHKRSTELKCPQFELQDLDVE